MEVPLLSTPRPRSSSAGVTAAAAASPAADPHAVQLSRYDGRLLLDRAIVPNDDGFASADNDAGQQYMQPQRFNHYLVATSFLAAVAGYAAVLLALGLRYDWAAHQGEWAIAISGQVCINTSGVPLHVSLAFPSTSMEAEACPLTAY